MVWNKILVTVVAMACSSWAIPLQAAVLLQGNSSHPAHGMFALDQPVELIFDVTGLDKNVQGLSLKLRIVNGYDKLIEEKILAVKPGADGRWHGTITAPHARLGLYRVYASLSDGTKLAAQGSRPAGYLTYAVVPDPAKRRLVPQSRSYFAYLGGFADGVPWVGGHWNVVGGGGAPYAWKLTEPKYAGQFLDRRKQAASQNKDWPRPLMAPPHTQTADGRTKPWPIYPICWLFDPPAWAVVPSTYAYASGALSSIGEKAWATYCRNAATAFVQQYAHLDQRVYQLTWEPMFPWGYKGTDEQLLRIYQIAYPILHEVDPNAVVLGPTGDYMGHNPKLTWDMNLLKKGLGKYVDGWAEHPYFHLPAERHGIIQATRKLQAALREYAGPNVQIWGLEQGAQAIGPKTEISHASGLIREHLIGLGEGVRMNIAFMFHDAGSAGYGYFYNLHPKKSFGTKTVAPKMIAPAYAAMTDLLEGYESAGAIEWLGETAWGYAYELDQQVMLALWDYGNAPHEVSLPVGVKQVHVYDMMGNRRQVTCVDDKLQIKLTQAPVYVSGVSPKLWGLEAQKPLVLTEQQTQGFPGGQVVIGAKLHNSQTAALTQQVQIEVGQLLRADQPLRKVTLSAGSQQEMGWKISIPPTTPVGNYPVKLTLLRGGQAVAATGLMLRVSPPVTVTGVHAMQANGKPALCVSLSEQENRVLTGRLQTRLQGVPESKQQVTWQLQPGHKRDVMVPYKQLQVDPTRIWPVSVQVTTDAGYRFKVTNQVDLLTAVSPSATPVIDGKLDEWPANQGQELSRDHLVRSPQFYGDQKVKVWFGQDQQYLYLACRVWDKHFVQNNTADANWAGDAIQLGVNLDILKGEHQQTGDIRADTSNAHRKAEINMALTPDGPQAYRYMYDLGLLNEQEIHLKIAKQSDGLIYETAIPWTTLGLDPGEALPRSIGLYCIFNSKDTPDQRDVSALGLFVPNTVSNGKQWGTLFLPQSSNTSGGNHQ